MATINNPQLTVSTHPLLNTATVVASCDVELTDFEVNAVNMLRLRYTVDCRVINRDIQYEDTVIRYDSRDIPQLGYAAESTNHVVFEIDALMSDLHEHILTNDQLIAEFTLTDRETGAQQTVRSKAVEVDLVA
jgi:hypothetical protein